MHNLKTQCKYWGTSTTILLVGLVWQMASGKWQSSQPCYWLDLANMPPHWWGLLTSIVIGKEDAGATLSIQNLPLKAEVDVWRDTSDYKRLSLTIPVSLFEASHRFAQHLPQTLLRLHLWLSRLSSCLNHRVISGDPGVNWECGHFESVGFGNPHHLVRSQLKLKAHLTLKLTKTELNWIQKL